MDADRIAFEIAPSVLGLLLVIYSVVHIRKLGADFFTVIRGWIFTLFIASIALLWAFEALRGLFGTWGQQPHIAIYATFMVVMIWLSVCLVALNSRYRTFSSIDQFSDMMKRRPINIITAWGFVGLVVIVYSWVVDPIGSQIKDEIGLLTALFAYLVSSIVVDFILPLMHEEGFDQGKGARVFAGVMRGVGLAWIGIPASLFALFIVLGNFIEYDGPNPYSWVMVALFAGILGSITETRFTALIVDPEVENAKKSGFRAYDIPRGPYIIEDEKSDSAMQLFSELISLPLRPDANIPGKENSASATLEYLIPRGIIVTREFPDNIRERFNIQVTPIIWLTETTGERRIAPTSLAVLTDTLIRFMESNPNSIILLEGIEYLVTFNEFKKVLKHLDSLNETTWISKARTIMTLNPRAFDDKELAMIERDRRVIKGVEGVDELKRQSKVTSS
ncbi:MAG: DUF835 domain-containing protein [Candidatus Thermoplasmatota archaeon]|nr:DUF835 domain-containing protein [Candidatus Thermoplasmatota archaeon]